MSEDTFELRAVRLTEELSKPFPAKDVLSRKGGGGTMLDYVTFEKIWERLSDTCPSFDWELKSLQTVGDGENAIWVCHGTLTIDGLGSRDGVGTDKVIKGGRFNEESSKVATTDAFKRACVLFGVGISLYAKDDAPAKTSYNKPSPARDDTQRDRNDFEERQAQKPAYASQSAEGQCPECHAPAGKHGTKCSRRAA